MTEEMQPSFGERVEILLQKINTDVRIGDDWNEIQSALREIVESEDQEPGFKELMPKIESFIKAHKIKAK